MVWLAALTGCAWISAEERDEALARAGLGLALVEGPDPTALATCALPGETTVGVTFDDSLDGRSVAIRVRYVNDVGIPSEWTDLDTVALTANVEGRVLTDLVVPVPADRCDAGCQAVELSATPVDESRVVDVLTLPFSVSPVEPQLVGAGLKSGPTVTPLGDVLLSTLEPAEAVNVEDWPDLTFTLDVAGWESGISAALQPALVACPAGAAADDPSCVELSSTTLDTGRERTFVADLAPLALGCGTSIPPERSLFVRLEGGPCDEPPIDLDFQARFAVSDCDGDGEDALAWEGTDCLDSDAMVNVGNGDDANCDGIDQNCDGTPDDGIGAWYPDVDSDGFGDPDAGVPPVCPAPSNHVQVAGDCDDLNELVFPGNAETSCDGLDNDCNLQTPDDPATSTWYRDDDGDGLGDSTSALTTDCAPPGYVQNASDCDDTDPEQPSPGWYPDADGDGLGLFGAPPQTLCPGGAFAQNDDDCNDTEADPSFSVLTLYPDADDDGLGHPTGAIRTCTPDPQRVPNGWDCDDGGATFLSQATEGAVITDSGTYPADTFDWDTLDGYTNVRLCADLSGRIEVADVVLDTTDLHVRSETGYPVTLVPAGAHRVITHDSGTLTLENVRIEDGDAGTGRGGCIQSLDTLNLVDVTLVSCHANGRGGALDVFDATLTGTRVEGSSGLVGGGVHVAAGGSLAVTNTTFEVNTAELGGAIGCDSCSIDIADSAFERNTATSNPVGDGYGGAIRIDGFQSALSVARTTFYRNAADRGGAIHATGGITTGQTATVDVADSLFLAQSASDAGGHLWIERTMLTVSDSRLEQGQAATGGAIHAAGVENDIHLFSTDVVGTSAVSDGGALWLGDTVLDVSCVDRTVCGLAPPDGVRFEGNAAGGNGGAVFTTGERPVDVKGALFVDNTAANGGAVWFEQNLPGTPPVPSRFENTLFDGNVAQEGSALSTGGGDAVAPAVLQLSNVQITTLGGPGSTIYANSDQGAWVTLTFDALVLTDYGAPQVDLRFQGAGGASDWSLDSTAGECSRSGGVPDCI